MKTTKKILLVMPIIALVLLSSISAYPYKKTNKIEIKLEENQENSKKREILIIDNEEVHDKYYRLEVYDGMTLEELAAKLDRSLNSTISGKGYLYASHSLEIGLDPYLAVAVTLLETGCKWNCSYLTYACNNVGGQKGGPSCNGSSYKSYPTLDEGIIGFMDNLYYNYVAIGLTTPEMINKKYAESSTWAYKVNNYIKEIKNA